MVSSYLAEFESEVSKTELPDKTPRVNCARFGISMVLNFCSSGYETAYLARCFSSSTFIIEFLPYFYCPFFFLYLQYPGSYLISMPFNFVNPFQSNYQSRLFFPGTYFNFILEIQYNKTVWSLDKSCMSFMGLCTATASNLHFLTGQKLQSAFWYKTAGNVCKQNLSPNKEPVTALFY